MTDDLVTVMARAIDNELPEGLLTDDDHHDLAQAAIDAIAAAGYAVVPVREEVAAFAVLMERELKANDYKGGWYGHDWQALAARVMEESLELKQAVDDLAIENACGKPPSPELVARIGEEAADVGNMAMMVADVCGALSAAAFAGRKDA